MEDQGTNLGPMWVLTATRIFSETKGYKSDAVSDLVYTILGR